MAKRILSVAGEEKGIREYNSVVEYVAFNHRTRVRFSVLPLVRDSSNGKTVGFQPDNRSSNLLSRFLGICPLSSDGEQLPCKHFRCRFDSYRGLNATDVLGGLTVCKTVNCGFKSRRSL